MSIGERIRRRREELGLSLEDVGSALKVHRSTILRYENGDTRRISPATIEKLAAVLKTTPAELMGWDQPPAGDNELDPEIRMIARNMQKMPKKRRSMLIKLINTMSDIADEEMKRT